MNILQLFKPITTFIFDVDGVLTDGSLTITSNGEMLRTMNVKDGFAMKAALDAGYKIAIISGGQSMGIERRFQQLGLKDIFTGQQHKQAAFDLFKNKHGLHASEIAYMGDDLPDYELLKQVGLSACPNDAAKDIKSICQYISPINGGKGCVRDLIEMTLKLHGKWWSEHSHTW